MIPVVKRFFGIVCGAVVGIVLAIVNEFLVLASNESYPQTKDTTVSVIAVEIAVLIAVIAFFCVTRRSRSRWLLASAGLIFALAILYGIYSEVGVLSLVPWRSELSR
jgi:hypothetical protein